MKLVASARECDILCDLISYYDETRCIFIYSVVRKERRNIILKALSSIMYYVYDTCMHKIIVVPHGGVRTHRLCLDFG
jgi:hypothetical protein